MQLLEVGDDLSVDGTDLQLEQRPHAGQQGRIQPIGLGQLAGGFGEPAGLTGIDLDDRQSGHRQGPLQLTMIGTGGLEHDPAHRPSHPGDQGLMAG